MTLQQEILNATENLDGWCEPGKQLTLAHLVLALRPSVIVEIGVWGGKSLIPMAMAALKIPNTIMLPRIVAIDPWSAEESVKGQENANKDWWGNQAQHDLVHGRFITAITRLGIKGFIQVERTSSDRVAIIRNIGLLHVDGNHGSQALKDVMKFAPSVAEGGVCVLDDLNWEGGAVGNAAEWLKSNRFIELHPLGTGAVYQKV